MPDPYREATNEEKAEAPREAPHHSVEDEILELERELAEKKEALSKEKPIERVLAKEAAQISTSSVSDIQPSISPKTQAVADDAQKLKSYEKNQQLKALVDLAFQKGVFHAADVVRNLDDPYLMDEFHDTLVDQLHDELVGKGKLEEL